jgi:hypothetical protein
MPATSAVFLAESIGTFLAGAFAAGDRMVAAMLVSLS